MCNWSFWSCWSNLVIWLFESSLRPSPVASKLLPLSVVVSQSLLFISVNCRIVHLPHHFLSLLFFITFMKVCCRNAALDCINKVKVSFALTDDCITLCPLCAPQMVPPLWFTRCSIWHGHQVFTVFNLHCVIWNVKHTAAWKYHDLQYE